MKLTAGMVVMIYEDPINMTRPEGLAELMSGPATMRDKDGLEWWSVRFVKSNAVRFRQIAPETAVPEEMPAPKRNGHARPGPLYPARPERIFTTN